MPEVVARNVPDTPLLTQLGLEVVFFSSRRTLSRELESVTSSLTSLSAIRCRVHRPLPAAVPLHAIIVVVASTLLSNVRGRPLRGASWSSSRICPWAFCWYFLRTL